MILRNNENTFIFAKGFAEEPVQIIYPCVYADYKIKTYEVEKQHEKKIITGPVLNIHHPLVMFDSKDGDLCLKDYAKNNEKLITELLKAIIEEGNNKIIFICPEISIRGNEKNLVYRAYLINLPGSNSRIFDIVKIGVLKD